MYSDIFATHKMWGGWARRATRYGSPKGCDIFATVCLLYPTKN